MSLTATCHCGGTRIELPRLPERRLECNCTYCAKTGAVWGYFGAGEMQFVKDDRDRVVRWRANNRHFGRCGIATSSDSPQLSKSTTAMARPRTACRWCMPTRRATRSTCSYSNDFDLSGLTARRSTARNNW